MESKFSAKEIAAWKAEYAAGITDVQFDLWIEGCERRNLVPVEDVVIQIRSTKEWDDETKAKVWKRKPVFITTIRALLKLAERTGKYKGLTATEWIYLNADGYPVEASLVPLPETDSIEKPKIPWAARVGARRAGFDEPQVAVARFWAYAQTYETEDAQKKKTKVLNSMWSLRGPEQLAKCAAAAALRLAFPEEMGDLYLSEEFPEEPAPKSTVETKVADQKSVAPPPTSNVAPPVNQAPAEGKDNPRPEDPVKETTPAPETDKAPAKRTRKKAAETTEAPAPVPETPPAEEPKKATPAEQEPKKEPELERLPTKEEGARLSAELKRHAAVVGSEDLRSYILRVSKKQTVQEIPMTTWTQILKRLDSALDNDDLKAIVAPPQVPPCGAP